LLDDGASPNAQCTKKLGENWWSETAVLYIACEKKHEDIVELLLGRGADPNSYLYRYENMQQETIPALIAAFPSLVLVERLLEAGANPNTGHWRRENAGWEQSPLRHMQDARPAHPKSVRHMPPNPRPHRPKSVSRAEIRTGEFTRPVFVQ
jgi:hypothetical protein